MNFIKKFFKRATALQGLSLTLMGVMIISLFSVFTPTAVPDWEEGVLKIIGGVAIAGGTMLALATAPVTVPLAVTTAGAIVIGAGGVSIGLGIADVVDDIFNGDESGS